MSVVADLLSCVAQNHLGTRNYSFVVNENDDEKLLLKFEPPASNSGLGAALAFANHYDVIGNLPVVQKVHGRELVVEVKDATLEKLFQRAKWMAGLTKVLLHKHVQELGINSFKVAKYSANAVVRIGVAIESQTELQQNLRAALLHLSTFFGTTNENLQFEGSSPTGQVPIVMVDGQQSHFFCPLQFPKLTMAIHNSVSADIIIRTLTIEQIANNLIRRAQGRVSRVSRVSSVSGSSSTSSTSSVSKAPRCSSTNTGNKRHRTGEQEKKQQNKKLCPVCCHGKLEFIALPCGHYCYCADCVAQAFVKAECFYCKRTVREFKQVFECD